MGTRIDFFLNPVNSMIGLLESEYQNFREWMLNVYFDEPNPEPFYCWELIDFLDKNSSLKSLLDLDSQLIDEITQNYFGDYFFTNSKLKFKGLGSSLYYWHYTEEAEIINETCNEKAFYLWKFLYNGRSIKNKTNFFNPLREEYLKIGYWQKEEKDYLLEQFNKNLSRKLENYKKENKNPALININELLNEISGFKNELIFIMS